MPVTTKHPLYSQHIDEWQQCRDAAAGSKAIKAAGEKYLPRLTSQEDKEYEAYIMRALFYGATGRTVQGLVGSVFRKPLQVDVPTPMKDHLKDITLTGVTLEGFCKTALDETVRIGRYGILVEMGQDAEAEGAVVTDADRPYWVGYRAEDITSWMTTQVKGDTVLTMVILREEVCQPDPADPFETIRIPQYRVLRLIDGKYVIELWRENKDKKDKWELDKVIHPTFRKQAITYIPFCFMGPTATTPTPEKPPLLDLVDVNISHYRSSADLEHGRHFCGLPTPWVAGFPETAVLKIGSAIAWVTTNVQAKAGMLEFTGQGLGALENALEDKEGKMAILGARMLEEQKKQVEAEGTHAMRNAGETSVLQGIAGTTEAALLMALQWHADWMGIANAKLKLELNKVFVEARMGPPELAEMVRTWQAGAMSDETLYWNMQRGELTRPDVTFEQEKALIATQAPARMPLDDSEPGEAYS